MPPAAAPTASVPSLTPLAHAAERLKWKRQAAEEQKVAIAKALADAGITDPVAFKEEQAKRQEELAKLKQAEDERARQSMSEQERLSADLAQAKARIAELESELNELHEQRTESEQSTTLKTIASSFVDADLIDSAVDFHFKKHVKSLDAKAINAIDDTYTKRWFKQFAKDHPKYAIRVEPAADDDPKKPPAAPAPAPVIPRRVVRRLTNGAPPKPPPGGPPASKELANNGSKVVKAGHPNSMSKEELRKLAASNGVKWPT